MQDFATIPSGHSGERSARRSLARNLHTIDTFEALIGRLFSLVFLGCGAGYDCKRHAKIEQAADEYGRDFTKVCGRRNDERHEGVIF